MDYGFRVVLSSRFGDIFRSNCGKAGLLAGIVDQSAIEELWTLLESDPATTVTVDLVSNVVRAGNLAAGFSLDDYTRWRLLEGLDDIAITLSSADRITQYEAARQRFMPSTLPS